jgi:hypothetical protein
MLAQELLEKLGRQELQKVARFFGLKKRQYASMNQEQLIDALMIGYRDGLPSQLARLTRSEMDLLIFLCMSTYAFDTGAELNDVGRVTNQRRNLHQTLQSLAGKGMIWMSRERWNAVIYVPEEVFVFLLHREAAPLIKKPDRSIVGTIKPKENYGLAAVHDLIHLLSAIAHGRIEVTQQGDIYKRQMKKLNEQCRLNAELFKNLYFDADYANIQFWKRYLRHCGVISIPLEHRVIRIKEQSLELFAQVTYLQWIIGFYDFYRERYAQIHTAPVPTTLCLALLTYSGQDWVLQETLYERVHEWCTQWNFYIDERMFNSLFYHPFLIFGLIETGIDEQGRAAWRWTDWGKAWVNLMTDTAVDHDVDLMTEGIYVQPNLEIMVPENILPAIRWRVETFAELKNSDTVLIYEWSKARIEQAAEAGWTLPEIEDFVQTYSKNPVPDNVLQTLRDWLDHYGKAKLWDVLVLQVREQEAAHLLTNKKINEFIVTSFSPTTVVIRRNDEMKLRTLMNSLGYPLPRTVASPDHPLDRSSFSQASEREMNQKTYAPGTLKQGFDRETMRGKALGIKKATNDLNDFDLDYPF